MKDFTILLSDNYLFNKYYSTLQLDCIILYYIILWCFMDIAIFGFLILLRNMWNFCILFLGQDILYLIL